MPRNIHIPNHLLPSSRAKVIRVWASEHLNFYRVHLLCFTFIPLIVAGIFYASNGENHVPFIDCLFVCVSAATVTGLSTINLSILTPWQQVILFILMATGSVSTVSIVMVLIRRYFFHERFEHVLREQKAARAERKNTLDATSGQGTARETGIRARLRSFTTTLRPSPDKPSSSSHSSFGTSSPKPPKSTSKSKKRKLLPTMIRRVDGPALVNRMNPGGWISESQPNSPQRSPRREPSELPEEGRLEALVESPRAMSPVGEQEGELEQNGEAKPEEKDQKPLAESRSFTRGRHGSGGTVRTADGISILRGDRRSSEPGGALHPSVAHHLPAVHTPAYDPNTAAEDRFPRSATIAIREPEWGARRPTAAGLGGGGGGVPLERSATRYTSRSGTSAGFPRTATRTTTTMNRGFGGFPTPFTLMSRAAQAVIPSVQRRFSRTVTMPRTNTLASTHRTATGGGGGGGTTLHGTATREVPYISFDAVVGRNSVFQGLTDEEEEELGGVEYRALKLLAWLLVGYYLVLQLIGFIIIAPYISLIPRFEDIVTRQGGTLHTVWYSAFQVVSAYSNTGMSLVDTSLIEFQTAYAMIFTVSALILLGNTCFPIMLRFIIWIGTKVVSPNSRVFETLHFLLDHPRRCFIYLFPSHQTWFLLTVVVAMILTDFVSFLVLDIGNPTIEAIPIGPRIAAGVMQSTAVRAAGFCIVNLGSLAPSVQIVYVVMMFVYVYPIAMSVRGTNVYEAKSLGIFEDDPEDEEPANLEGSRGKVWGAYLGWHVKKQLAFDIWWLAFALWLLCIFERGKIWDPEKSSYFSIFSILFELVSAYGTVGLSLGVSSQPYSLSGEMSMLSKLLLMVVMIRGRHRGLPVAIDRAVLLPSDVREQDAEEAEALSIRRSRTMQPFHQQGETATFNNPLLDPHRHSSQLYHGPPFPPPPDLDDKPPPAPSADVRFGGYSSRSGDDQRPHPLSTIRETGKSAAPTLASAAQSSDTSPRKQSPTPLPDVGEADLRRRVSGSAVDDEDEDPELSPRSPAADAANHTRLMGRSEVADIQ